MNAPTPNDDQAMRAALQRDAAQVSEPPFNAALHDETMRRIRGLATKESKTPWFATWPALATAAAALALTAGAALWLAHPPSPHAPPAIIAETFPAPARASLLAYELAARDGDTALFAALDRDAARLLPASPDAFKAVLQ